MFFARKLLRYDRLDIQKNLQEVIYVGGRAFSADSISTLLNGAVDVLPKTKESVSMDFKKVPEDGVSPKDAKV